MGQLGYSIPYWMGQLTCHVQGTPAVVKNGLYDPVEELHAVALEYFKVNMSV